MNIKIMESKEQIKKRLKDKYGIEPTSNSDFTQLPDEILANAHLYDWIDKVSIQAGVEMSRRMKNAVLDLGKIIVLLNEKNEKMQRRIYWLTIVGVVFTTTQIVQVIDILIDWIK